MNNFFTLNTKKGIETHMIVMFKIVCDGIIYIRILNKRTYNYKSLLMNEVTKKSRICISYFVTSNFSFRLDQLKRY